VTAAPLAISVDVEDWPQSTWNRSLPITERAARNALRLLEILAGSGVRATMFVLGKFAETFPDIVRQIASAGHEVASHGYGHEEIFGQTRTAFAEDLRRSKDRLEQITGREVRGYRAPDFSIVRRTLWALEELAEQGFAYDSSIYPVRRPRYGIPEWPVGPTRVLMAGAASLVEFPIASYSGLGRNWPVGGGGYHRLLPGAIGRFFASRVMRTRPFIYYCHPYEFDPDELKELSFPVPLRVRLHQGLGRGRFEKRFTRLVRRFGGCPIGDLVEKQVWPALRLDALKHGEV
jgi:polysaccharide deacetylase family protein (PEP-CTERM system associated)